MPAAQSHLPTLSPTSALIPPCRSGGTASCPPPWSQPISSLPWRQSQGSMDRDPEPGDESSGNRQAGRHWMGSQTTASLSGGWKANGRTSFVPSRRPEQEGWFPCRWVRVEVDGAAGGGSSGEQSHRDGSGIDWTQGRTVCLRRAGAGTGTKGFRNKSCLLPTGCPAPWARQGCSQRSAAGHPHPDRASSRRCHCCAGWDAHRRCCIRRHTTWDP